MSDCTSFKSKSVFLPTALAVLLATFGGTPVRAADAVTPGEFVVERPTLICLGFQWFVDGDDNRNSTVKVEYRAKGLDPWKQPLPLLRIKGEKVGLGNPSPTSTTTLQARLRTWTRSSLANHCLITDRGQYCPGGKANHRFNPAKAGFPRLRVGLV